MARYSTALAAFLAVALAPSQTCSFSTNGPRINAARSSDISISMMTVPASSSSSLEPTNVRRIRPRTTALSRSLPSSLPFSKQKPPIRKWFSQCAVSSTSNDFDYDDDSRRSSRSAADPEQILSSMSSAARDAFLDDPDDEETQFLARQQRVADRQKKLAAATTKADVESYAVTFPPKTNEQGEKQTRGLRLAQIYPGRRLGKQQLDLDTFQMTAIDGSVDSDAATESAVDNRRQAVVVVAVEPDSLAYQQGVRVGDILQQTSATIGTARWPQSTLEGVRSAVSSRQGDIQLDFVRSKGAAISATDAAATVDSTFELTLTRPLGMELKETPDGYVEVTGFTDSAPKIVRYAVQVGDRILAVDSSLGDKLWPVSTVEGVISSVTARFPGQKITMRFQRPERNMQITRNDADADSASMKAAEVAELTQSSAAAETIVAADSATTTASNQQDTDLLARCRGIIKRYMTEEKFVEKFDVPALVADRVLEALANAETTVDGVTLSMIMVAYLSCRQPQGAIAAFEACTGLAADGSDRPVVFVKDATSPKHIVPSPAAALDVYTISSLLKAHLINKDLAAVRRVLVAAKGRAGSVVNGLPTADWPGTGEGGTIAPDTRCYNIALKATTLLASDPETGLNDALKIFNAMGTRTGAQTNGDAPKKDLVTYNTMLSALTNVGRYSDAIDLFYAMRNDPGIVPDKFSYTSIIEACESSGDLQELLYDMREQGIEADVVTYNTIIRLLCEEGNFEQARDTITQMEASGVTPDSMTYGTLMKSLLRSGNPRACITLFETACSDVRTAPLTENVHLFTMAITAAAKLNDHERALDLWSRMGAAGVKANTKTLTILMGACLASGKPKIAANVFERIEKLDGMALAQGIQALSESGRASEAFDLLRNTKSSNRWMTCSLSGKQLLKAYEHLTTSALQENNFQLARDVMADMFNSSHIPSRALYEAVFKSMNLDVGDAKTDQYRRDKFSFLLFMIDLVQERNMPVSGFHFQAVLNYADRVGGLARKIAALLVFIRGNSDDSSGSGTRNNLILDDNSEEHNEFPVVTTRWEDMFNRYDDLTAQVKDPSQLPPLRVQIASKDVMSVLRSEQGFSSAAARRRRRQMV